MATTVHPTRRTSIHVPADRPSVVSFGVLVTLVLMCVFSIIRLSPPQVVSATAPPTMFSSGRAMKHLREIAQHPHPTGSAENARVRTYLVHQLEALGLQPQVQSTSSVVHHPVSSTAAVVHNVVARITGTDSTGAQLLVAHYDSVATSPGASDDGSGVVTILEAVRALQAGPALKNDVIVLFTDAEELGLLGAHAFAREHPWMADVRLVLNLEARGASGPVVMFETSSANAGLIREYAEVVPRPVTSSLLSDVYRLLPNDTDLTVFLHKNIPGLNFAYADGWTSYHTGHDSLEKIDERSVQHHGVNLLALTQHFGNLDLRATTSDNAIFFSLLSHWVIHYPQGWVIPLLMLAALAFLGLLTMGRNRGRVTVIGVVVGSVAIAGCATLLGALAYGGVQALNALEANELSVFMGGTYNIHWYELGFLIVFIGVGGWLIATTVHHLQPRDHFAGTLLVWLALAAATSVWLPGASYLFIWPLLAGLAALALQLCSSHPMLARLSVLLPGLVAVLLMTPAAYMVMVMAGINAVIILAALVVLVLGLIVPPLIDRAQRGASASIPAIALVAGGVTLLLITALTTHYDHARPRQNNVFYSLNADRQEAAWVAIGQTHEPWAESFTGGVPAYEHLHEHFPVPTMLGLDVATGIAPTLNISPPAVTVLADSVSGSTRTLQLRIASERGATQFGGLIASPGGVISTSLYGDAITYETPPGEVMLNVVGEPGEGLDLTVTVPRDQPLTLQVADITPVMPVLGMRVPPRPDSVTAMAGGFTPDTSTVVHHTIRIPARP